MLDFDEKRSIELQIDKMLRVRNGEVVALAKQANDARKRNDYERAKVLVEKIHAVYHAPKTVASLLVSAGKAPNSAQARHIIDSRGVLVDGVRCRNYRQTVSDGQEVLLDGKRVTA